VGPISQPFDREIAAALGALPAGTFDFDEWTLETVAARRSARAALPVPAPPPTTTVFHDEIVGDAVSVRVYSPPDAGSHRPCLYWIHGGGYIMGSALTVDARLNWWVESLVCVVVAVEYRLAPENPYPIPLEDCYAGLEWTAANADRLGIDPARIVIAGASAGGGLAAAVALTARDRSGPSLAHQVLIYPMLDDRHISPSSRNEGVAVWGPAANRLGAPTSARRSAARKCRPTPLQPERLISAVFRPHSLRSAGRTYSVTRTSTMPRGSWRQACRPSSTCMPAPPTAST
jgi:acetyl esterase/lipase